MGHLFILNLIYQLCEAKKKKKYCFSCISLFNRSHSSWTAEPLCVKSKHCSKRTLICCTIPASILSLRASVCDVSGKLCPLNSQGLTSSLCHYSNNFFSGRPFLTTSWKLQHFSTPNSAYFFPCLEYLSTNQCPIYFIYFPLEQKNHEAKDVGFQYFFLMSMEQMPYFPFNKILGPKLVKTNKQINKDKNGELLPTALQPNFKFWSLGCSHCKKKIVIITIPKHFEISHTFIFKCFLSFPAY